MLKLTVILPMHNEAKRVAGCVELVGNACRRLTGPEGYEILVAEDGSSDSTYAVARSLAANDRHVRVFHSEKRIGRGAALAAAIRASKGAVVAYMDADLSSDLKHLGDLVSRVEDGAAIATGSRLMRASRTKRSPKREIASRGYNFLVRAILGSRLHDHQCGFKALDRKKILPLLSDVRDTHWFWDTELIVRAQRKGLRIDEMPIEWAEKGRQSTVDLKKDVAYMASKILDLKLRLG